MHVMDLNAVVDVCRQGELLAVLPENIARASVEEGSLWRLPLDFIEPVSMFAVRRQQLVEDDLAEHTIGVVRGVVRDQIMKGRPIMA